MILFCGLFAFNQIHYNFEVYNTYGTGQNGFDTGIFSQSLWLLSHGQAPVSTIRGLNIFGDHASFILVALAPVYRIWPDPRLLMVLQVVAIAAAAYGIYRIARSTIGSVPAALISSAYLFLPAITGGVVWQFHPDALAAAFLVFAVLSYRSGHSKTMYALIALALLCKEVVALVIFGFAIAMWFERKRKAGAMLGIVATAYFIVALLIVHHFNDSGSPYLQANFGVDANDPLSILRAVPSIIAGLFRHSVSVDGMRYVFLVFAPFLFIVFRSWIFVPAVTLVVLNLASSSDNQRWIDFHYSLICGSLLTIAAVESIAKIALFRKHASVVTVVMLIATFNIAAHHSSTSPTTYQGDQTSAPTIRLYAEALKFIPDDASVSADDWVDVHIANRKYIYTFPGPFYADPLIIDGKTFDKKAVATVQYVVVNSNQITEPNAAELLRSLQDDTATWKTIYEKQGVIVLQRL